MSRLRRPRAGLLLVVIALATLAAAAVTTGPPAATKSPTGDPTRQTLVPLAQAAATCPAPDAGEATVSRVSVASSGPLRPEVASPPANTSEVALTAPGSRASALLRMQAPGSATVEPAAPAGEDEPVPLTARGSGASAPGLAVAQTTRSTDATMRGLAGTTCGASATEFWFVGSGARVGQRGRVYLTNPEPAPAVVDLTLYGPDGPIDAPDGRGIAVAAGEQEVRLLDALAPGTDRFAIRVSTRQGRVVAAVRDLQIDGLTPLGADWVPAAVTPTRRLVVPGVPGGLGERRLQVVAAGEADAIVRVRLLGAQGGFAPPGLDVIEVRAGTVADIDLAEVTEGEPVAVALDADVPVTAGVLTRVVGGTGLLGELTYAAAAAPLRPDTPGVVAEVRQGEGVTSQLLLAAPGREAAVRVAPLPPATGTPRTIRVPESSQVVLDLATVSTAEVFAVTVSPLAGSGPVLAVRQIDEAEARGPFVTSSPVLPGRYVVPVPRVTPDLSAGLP